MVVAVPSVARSDVRIAAIVLDRMQKMARGDRTLPSLLDETWPRFLGFLDDQPGQAMAEFGDFLDRLLANHPPRWYRALGPEWSAEARQITFFFCCERDFRRLRQYRDTGRPFARWLATVVNCRSVDLLRQRRNDKPIPENVSDPRPNPGVQGHLSEVMAAVNRGIRSMNRQCQVLLRLAGDGLKPREITRVLGLPADQNKDVSDRLRYCRSRLVKLLRERGVDIGAVLSGAVEI